MIPYERSRQQLIPHSAIKIVGIGGAGANMLDRIALDGMEGAELLACNSDVRTLTSSVAPEKIQIGRNLTKGLGTGGDPQLGKQAAAEAELELRDSLRDRKIVFICVGLGGGTGSGAAPLVARLAREEGAVTVVFATTPFDFEGGRRRMQAETSLNELSVLANALITFDNTRMGELVLAQQGVHEAFSAADRMVSESIRAVTRIVMRPGLINIGLDDLMAALSSPKSRCLFGSGLAEGENRAQKALKNALSSPLLDRGSLLHDTETVLVHVCGGEDLTLYELELLMRGLSKHVPDTAQILFGTSVDPAMSNAMSVTLVSSLPEERLLRAASRDRSETVDFDAAFEAPEPVSEPEAEQAPEAEPTPEEDPEAEAVVEEPEEVSEAPEVDTEPEADLEPPAEDEEQAQEEVEEIEAEDMTIGADDDEDVMAATIVEPDAPFVDPEDSDPALEEAPDEEEASSPRVHLPPIKEPARRPGAPVAINPAPVAEGSDVIGELPEDAPVVSPEETLAEDSVEGVDFEAVEPSDGPASLTKEALEEIQAAAESRRPDGELALDGGPKGKFEGESPNLVEGEDLDIPPFLRNRG